MSETELSSRLDEVAPRAAGLAHVEVLEVKEVDTRGACGSLDEVVRLRLLCSSGITSNQIVIVKEAGGLTDPDAPAWEPRGPVHVGAFKVAQRYWVAYCSKYDHDRYPQGVVCFWPELDAPQIFEEAVREDIYRHGPHYHPDSGLTYSFPPTEKKDTWRIRMQRDERVLWEVDLSGERYKQRIDTNWNMGRLRRSMSGLDHAERDAPDAAWYLFADTVNQLESDNPYRLPPEMYHVRYALEADTGRIAAVWVSSTRHVPLVVQFFDVKSGITRREERYDWLNSGGLAVGAGTEQWTRQTVRTFDPNTGELLSQETFRSSMSPDGRKYVPIATQ
jgi:hypothetical protein